MKKKLIALLLAIVTIVSVGAITTVSANALSFNVTLKTNQKYAVSGACYALKPYMAAGNDANSKHYIDAIFLYNSATGVWTQDSKVMLKQGEYIINAQATTNLTTKKNWCLKLQSRGLLDVGGCSADGVLSDIRFDYDN